MYPISSEGLNKETDEAVYFYTPAFDALNNFSAHTIDIWGKRFPTAEHAFQWKKIYCPPEESASDYVAADINPAPIPGQARVRIGQPLMGEARARSTFGAGVSDIRNQMAQKILEAGSPEAAQQIAHKNKKLVPQEWHGKKTAVMEEILRAKLTQHEDVREVLKRTGTRRIVENSPVDDFWGCGPKGEGKNMMGELWMKLRDEQ